MKKLIFAFLFLLTIGNITAKAMITTENVDPDRFQYVVPYYFATTDLAASRTDELRTVANQYVTYYTIPRDGKIAGIAVYGNTNVTSSGKRATFDITYNGNPTGVKCMVGLEGNNPLSEYVAVGGQGKANAIRGYIWQDRLTYVAAQGFTATNDTVSYQTAEYPYGKASPIVAGNKIGVKVTTTSGWTDTGNDYAVVVYILQ
jgi:hypothetical protein